jgi:hypothetical protein
MERNFECRGIGNTVRILLTAVAALLVSAPVSAGSKDAERASKDAERAATCSDALTADYGATELSNFSHDQNGHHTVYATARLADGETIRFRCHIRRDTVVYSVEVYVPVNSAIVGSRAGWTSAEPYRVESEPDAEVPAEITPEQEEISPEFKTPGTGTGFKTPETGTGSQFKPAK